MTTYGYGTTPAGSDVARSDLLSSVTYPDGGVVTYSVNRQGQTKQFTDQRLVVHAYDFDLLGRQIEDRVISLGPSSSSSSSSSSSGSSGTPLTENYVDGTVQRIARTYEVRGLLQNVTSHSSPNVGQGTVVNDVQRVYNSFGQLVIEYQEHSGAVNTSTSVNVQYAYADGSANNIRPTQLIYPNGRVLYYGYGSPGGIDDALSRAASLIDNDGTTHLVDYTRLGADTFVQSTSPEPQIAWSLIGTGTDPYTGLDHFNRVVDNRWYSTATGANLDRIQHGYDRASNRLWRRNTVADAAGVYLDELYSYDGLYRLKEMQRGELSLGNNSIVSGTLGFAQAWGLDATGNWSQFWQNDTGASWNLQQSRTATSFNEIDGFEGGGWASPAYDAAGNMIQMPQPETPTTAFDGLYDAWNRLTVIASGGATIATNAYDGANRRLAFAAGATVRQVYYSARSQSIEERLGGPTSADRQVVWGIHNHGSVLLRDRGTERLYALQAGGGVSAICASSGVVSERYVYTCYGGAAFLSANFVIHSSSYYDWEWLFSSYRRDSVSGIYHVGRRWYSPLLGRWSSCDPIGFFGGPNLYEYVSGRPLRFSDPTGTSEKWDGPTFRGGGCTGAEQKCIADAAKFAVSFLENRSNCFDNMFKDKPAAQCTSKSLTQCIIATIKATEYQCESSADPSSSCNILTPGFSVSRCQLLKSQAAIGENWPIVGLGPPIGCQICDHPIPAANNCDACEQNGQYGAIRTTLCRDLQIMVDHDIESIAEWCNDLGLNGTKSLAVLLVHEAAHGCVGGHETTGGNQANPLSFDKCGRPDAWAVGAVFSFCIGL